MHLYNLPILKVSQRVLDAASKQRKYRNVKRPQSASIKDSFYYNVFIISDDTFYARKIDLDTGKIEEKQVKINNCQFNGIFLCKSNIILEINSNQICCIQAKTIFNISKISFITLQEKDFNYFSMNSAIDYNTVNFVQIEADLIMVYLLNFSLTFQKIAQSSKKKYTISAWDLGYGRNDKIIDFHVKNQIIFGNDSQRQLIVGVLKILQQDDNQIRYVLIEMLWNQSKYVSSQIYVCHRDIEEQTNRSKILLAIFSSLTILVYTGRNLIICKRLQEGIRVQGIISIYHQIFDIFCIQNNSNQQQILAVCKNKNKTRIYKYNLQEISNNLRTQPKIVHCDLSSSGEILGFLRLPTYNPLLVFSAQTCILMPTIFTLYQKITTIHELVQVGQNQIEDIQFILQSNNQIQLQFLSYSSFYKMVNKNNSQIDQAISELFSTKKMEKIVLQFQETLQRQIKCLKNDTSISWNTFLREYTFIFIYLLKFLNHIQEQLSQNRPLIALSDSYLIQIQNIFNQFYSQKPLVQEPKIQSLVHKKIIQIKQNLQSILILFSKTNTTYQTTTKNPYQYSQILKSLTISQVVEFVADKTSLVDFLAYFIYRAALQGNSQQWKMGRIILKKILQIRRDYTPLIGFLCGDIDSYTRSYQQLEYCKLLAAQQQKEEKELQNLPYLKQTRVAAPYYLKQAGFLHLLCFTPDEYEKHKYNGNFVVLNIPKSCSQQTFEVLKSETIQIREKIYLFLTQENVSKAIQRMQNAIDINFCVQSRCQVFIFSQRLRILNQVFLLQLIKCFEQKYRSRSQYLKNIIKRYDCRCLSNQQYQKIIKPKNYSFRDKNYKICKRQVTHEQIRIVQTFYSNLLQLCESFSLHKFISHLKNNSLKKNSVISDADNLNNIDISNISQNQKNNNLEENNIELFYEILFTNIWNLYDNILHYQQTKFIDFHEQLEYCSFPHSYLSIFQFLSGLLDTFYIKQLNRLYAKQQSHPISLQKLKKVLLNKKNRISFKNRSELSNFKQRIVKNIVRTELVLKMFSLTKQWIFDFQQLLFQSGINQIKLSYKNQLALSYLIEVNEP